LKVERQLSDLVDEERASARALEGAGARLLRVGEGASHVAEDLGLDEGRARGAAVEDLERPGSPPRQLVQGPREEVLADARLPLQQDDLITRRIALELRDALTHDE
jgi:hypothetical protein